MSNIVIRKMEKVYIYSSIRGYSSMDLGQTYWTSCLQPDQHFKKNTGIIIFEFY